jgi:hypothetical protein
VLEVEATIACDKGLASATSTPEHVKVQHGRTQTHRKLYKVEEDISESGKTRQASIENGSCVPMSSIV